MTALAPELDGAPDRDELLGGVVSLATVVRVLSTSLRGGVPMPPAHEGDADGWTERAALLSLLVVTRWHGDALLAVAQGPAPQAAVAHLRPLVEAWLRIEALVAGALGEPGIDDEVALAVHGRAALGRIGDQEWQDDLIAAMEISREALPHHFAAVTAASGALQVEPAEPADAYADRIAFLASRVIARSWATSFEMLGLPVLPASVWDGTGL